MPIVVAWVALLAWLAAWPGAAAAGEFRATPQDYLSCIRKLRPGDILTLAPGIYEHGLPLHDLEGAAGRPIIIAGDASGTATVFRARVDANTVSIKNAAYLVVRSLLLDGVGMPVDAVKAEGTSKFAHHITLENLTIVNHGVDQQVVGISTKCPAWAWVLRNNVIRGAGTGIYLGNSDGRAPFVGGLIENNLIVDTVGYNLQIKHQLPRPALAGMDDGPMQTIIRGNVFSKALGGSTGSLARPNVLLGHFPESGVGSEDEYEVYGNFFHDNPTESLLQAEGNVAVHDNVFMNPHGDAVRIQPHHSLPRRISIVHNTVLARNRGISMTGGDSRFRQIAAGNAVFADVPLSGGEQEANLAGSYESATDFLVSPFAGPGEIDVSPRDGRLSPSETMAAEGRESGARDFYGRCRDVPTVGAVLAGRGAPWRLDPVRRMPAIAWDRACPRSSVTGQAGSR